MQFKNLVQRCTSKVKFRGSLEKLSSEVQFKNQVRGAVQKSNSEVQFKVKLRGAGSEVHF